MARRILLKLLLMGVVGSSAAVPLQSLMERHSARPAPSPAAVPVLEKTATPATTVPSAKPAGIPAVAAPAATASPARPAAADPAAVPEPARPSPSSPSHAATAAGRRTYVVKEGDSLWSIADKELGSARWVSRLAEANRGQIDPNNLKVGQVLVIPDVDADAPKYR